jgi:hypothetical protein
MQRPSHRRLLWGIRLNAPRVGASVAIVAVLALSLACEGVRQGRIPSVGTSPIESLQASGTSGPTPTPLPLSPQQIDCINKFWGSVEEFRRYNPSVQHAILQGLQVDCVDKELGIVPPPPPTVQVSGPNARALTAPSAAIPTKIAGAGGILLKPGNPPPKIAAFPVIRVVNEWSEGGPTAFTDVWAGYADVRDQQTGTHDFSQGLLVVSATGKPDEAYPTPSKSGPIRIVDAVGETLELQAQDGTLFYFDVASRQFVSSLPAATATATPGQGRGNRGGTAAGASTPIGTPAP